MSHALPCRGLLAPHLQMRVFSLCKLKISGKQNGVMAKMGLILGNNGEKNNRVQAILSGKWERVGSLAGRKEVHVEGGGMKV